MQNPFKLLDSYQENESANFFGRDVEIASLYSLLQKTRLVLLYGASGTGKTSLIQAGMPKAFKLSEWLCIMIRRKDDINRSFALELGKASGIEGADPTTSILALYEKRWMPICFVFDQFEEIFTLGTATEKQAFFQMLRQLLEADLPCKFLLSMREEYIGHLYEYEKQVPELFDHRLRIEPMKDETVGAVIGSLCQSHEISLENDQVPALVLNQVKEYKQSVYLPYLQIYLYSLYEKASADNPVFSQSLIEKLGPLDIVLKPFISSKAEAAQKFLERKYGELPSDLSMRILDEFSTEEGTNKSQKAGEIAKVLQTEKQVVSDALQYYHDSAKLLRIDESDTERFELMHDTLAKLIFELRSSENKEWKQFLHQFQKDYSRWEQESRNNSRLLTEQDIAKLNIYEERLKTRNPHDYTSLWLPYIDASEKHIQKKKLRNRILFISISTIAIIAVILGAYASFQRNISKRIVDNTDFYEGLALAIDKESGKYGYMGRDGHVKIDFIYDEATPFNRNNNYIYGYARVKRGNTYYLLDTRGVEYKMANNQYSLKSDVTVLDLSEKYLSDFPDFILKNPQLKIILLRGNEIRSLPDSLWKLEHLEFFDLSENLLDSIPQSLCKLPAIRRLGLAWNPITQIPSYADGWNTLEFLDLSYCSLTDIPEAFSTLKSLNTLYCSGNSWSANPPVLQRMALKNIQDIAIDTAHHGLELPEMVWVKGDTFLMGKSSYRGPAYVGQQHEFPPHKVSLSDYYIGKYEVTQAFWNQVMAKNPSAFEGCTQCPVDKVSWYNAQKFLYKLNKLTGKHYRLPTEAEWEFAAKGGTLQENYLFSGANDLDMVAWYFYEKSRGTHEVGTKKPNGLGVYDMSGNLWEWCEDNFDSTYYRQCYDRGVVTDPVNRLPNDFGLYRGGDWFNAEPFYCFVTFRGPSPRNNNARQVGFRIVLPASGSK